MEALLRVQGLRTKGLLQLAFGLEPEDHCLEDAVCDASLLLLRKARRLDASRNLGGYFYVTARHELIRILKRQKDWHKSLWDGAENHLAAGDGKPAEGSPLAARIKHVVDGLSDLERQILGLDVANNFTLKAAEVAVILGTTESTVYSLRHRTKHKLKHLLAMDGNNPEVP